MQFQIGGRRIEPEDVVLVAACPAADTVQLVIEQPRIDSLTARDAAQQAPHKGKKGDAAPAPAAPVPAPSRPADGEALGEVEVRAVLTVKLVQMLHARAPLSQGLKTAQLLAALINARGHPVLRMDSEGDAAVLAQLADALSGAASAFIVVKGDSLSAPAALSRLGLQPVQLSAADRASFCCGLAVSTAIGVLAVHSARALLDGCDNLAALTAEAAECPIEPFAIAHHDQARTHSGQVAVANNLRTLLDGSKIVEKALSKPSAPSALALVPQLHGPARDAFNTALKAVRTELNAVEGGSESAQWAEFHPQPLVQPLAALHSALATLGAASEARIQLLASLQKGLAQPTVTEALDSLVSAVSATVQQLSSGAANSNQLLAAVAQSDAADHKAEREGGLRLVEAVRTACGRVTSVLSVEALVALLIVDHRDRAAIQSSIEAIRKKEEALKKREAEMKAKADAGGKPGKEPKAADKVDRRPQGLFLAARTASLRSYLHSSTGPSEPGADYPAGSTVCIGSAAAPHQELKRFYDAFQRALDPLNGAFRELAAQALVSSNVMVKPKVPKGTKDSFPWEISIREKVFGKIIEIFRRHGAVGIDTPVFELKETLTNKYGEDSKLIYDLADQGGEMLSLRYDLTVPLARYIATHNVTNIKRYHIGRVYRRDNPVMSKGRFREFYQCDYDIAGVYAPMVPDAEVIKTFVEILEELDVGAFLVKVNHRKLLDAVMAVCGVPPAKFRPICSAIDKLDKEEWETVKAEMVQQKGLPEPVADRIGTYVKRRSDQHLSPLQLLKLLREDANFQRGSKALTEEAHAMAETAFTELGLFFEYLEAMGCINRITFDLSLARGLDYYTGVIYEAILTGQNQVGSIGAGGRYDELVRSFCGRHVPVVGVSVGIERIFNILCEREKQRTKGGVIRASQTQVLVASVGSNMLLHRMALCNELWAAGIKAEFLFDLSPKPQKQIDYCFENQIPFVIWLGGDEIRDGVVKFKNLVKEEQITVNRRDIVKHLLKLLEDPLPELPPPPAAPAEEEKEAKPKDGKAKDNKESKNKDNKEDKPKDKEAKPKDKKKDAQ